MIAQLSAQIPARILGIHQPMLPPHSDKTPFRLRQLPVWAFNAYLRGKAE